MSPGWITINSKTTNLRRRQTTIVCLFLFITVSGLFFTTSCGLEYRWSNITINNNTNLTITEVYIAEEDPAGAVEEWGDNLISEPIPPGEGRLIEQQDKTTLQIKTVFETGFYNIKKVDTVFTTDLTVNINLQS